MSIYTTEQLVDKVNLLRGDEAKVILVKLLQRASTTPSRRAEMARLILGLDQSSPDKTFVQISKDRLMSQRKLEILNGSPMLDYVQEIVEAALDLRGPFQTTDLLLVAAQLKKEKAFFIESTGIKQKWLNQAGHILTMAGFERVSHYSRERRMPLKVWKPTHGTANLGIEERVREVFVILETEAYIEAPRPAPMTPPITLGDFL